MDHEHGTMDHAGPAAIDHGGHGGQGDHVARFRRLFWVMLALTVPVVAFSPMFAMLLGYELPDLPGIHWVSPVLGTVMYVRGGYPFLSGAATELRARKPGMMLLIGLAITVAFVSSWGASPRHPGPGTRRLVGAGPADHDHAAGPLD